MAERVEKFRESCGLPDRMDVRMMIEAALQHCDAHDEVHRITTIENRELRLVSSGVSAAKAMVDIFARLGLPRDTDPDADGGWGDDDEEELG